MSERAPLLEIEGLAKSYGGVSAVVDCTLSVPANSLVGLIGPNGAGKSTVINIVSGFTRPDSGRIRFDGREIQGWPAHRVSSVGLMRTFQAVREWPALTVMENMLAAANQQGLDTAWRSLITRPKLRELEETHRVRARELLDQFGLTAMKDEYAGHLSGGQKRLLEFARIVMAKAKMVLLDEPVAGVNPVLQEHILEAVVSLRDSGITCLLVEHNLPFVERACEGNIYVMALGRTIARGAMHDLRTDRNVIDAYLGEAVASA
jgi:ABC-type branched-subunit amino acid transport system ATPase component